MKKLVTSVLVCAALAVSTAAFGGAVAATGLPYQGRLTDAAGNPITGARDLTLTLYNTGGTVLYSETQNGVTITNGSFNVEIGLGTPAAGNFANAFNYPDLFLGIAVSPDPEMAPRIHLGYVPLARSTADAPGVATYHRGIYDTFYFGASAADAVSATITTPTDGYILVMAGGQVNTSASGYVSTWISDVAGSSQDDNNYGYVGLPSAPGYFQLERHRVYAKPAGTHTFYLAGRLQTGAAGSYLWEGTITALFIPKALGSFTLAPSGPAPSGAVPAQQSR